MSQQPPEFNPYQSAGTDHAPAPDDNFLSRTTGEIARWQTFFAVLMSIGVVLMLGAFGLSMLSGPGDAGAAIGGMLCIGGVTLLMYGLPAIMLWRAANGARSYSRSPTPPQLAEFASSQLIFWRTVGIIAALVLGLYALIFVGAMLFGVGMALS